MSIRAIARSPKASPSTVGDYLRRAESAGMSWPLDESLDDAQLERRLFPVPVSSRVARPLPQWSELHRELRGKGVTLALLWQEYKAVHPQRLQYSRFCEQYRAWASTLVASATATSFGGFSTSILRSHGFAVSWRRRA